MPLDHNLLFGKLDPAEDINQDGVPDITATVTEGEAPVIIFNNNLDLADPNRIFRAWWLQAYHHSKSVLDFAVDNFERFDLSARIVPVAITPASFAHGAQSWAPPSQRVPGFAEILTSTTFEVGRDARNQPIVEDVVPTILQHEVGHHIFFSVTNAHETDDERIEEGIADAIVGLTNKDCRVGFRSETGATSLGFCLGTTGDFRPGLRAKIGNSFFRLHILLSSRPIDPEPFTASGLLLHWLARHRVQDPRQRILGDIEGIRDEILAINRGPAFDSMRNCPVRCSEEEVHAAFGDFLIALFVRGDANLDQKVDLSDAVAILNFLFGGQGTFHDCKDAMDADDNALLEITDAIRILNFLFLGSGALPAPFPECEQDPVLSDSLGCLEFTCPR
jgi:hypothetical protein